MGTNPWPQALGGVSVGQCSTNPWLERAKVALSDRVLVDRVRHGLGVPLDEVLRHRLYLWPVEARLVVGVPPLDEASREAMLDPPSDVFHRRGNLAR